jgi:hypothetical protein
MKAGEKLHMGDGQNPNRALKRQKNGLEKFGI